MSLKLMFAAIIALGFFVVPAMHDIAYGQSRSAFIEPLENATNSKSVALVESAILAALNEESDFDFFEQPLTDIVQYIRVNHRISIRLDLGGLDLAGVSPEDQITHELSKVSLRSNLRLLLNRHDLTYMLRDEVLLITSTEAAGEMMYAKSYDISDLLASMSDTDPDNGFPMLITRFIDSDSWSVAGGTGEIAVMRFSNQRAVLLVSQTTTVHEDISALLTDLCEQGKAKETGTKQTETE